jgi:hypothetical protein
MNQLLVLETEDSTPLTQKPTTGSYVSSLPYLSALSQLRKLHYVEDFIVSQLNPYHENFTF